MSSATPPSPGNLVNVRERRFVVMDVRESALTPDPLQREAFARQHLVTLSSVEDDAFGEELQVIWEIEPGARLSETISMPTPDGFDSPVYLDAFLNAVRWGAATSADVNALQAPFRSGIEIEDYQLDPVVRAISMPRVNLLIADDVGLGKTIEAGLVAQELILRRRARRILVVCPASLLIQWRDQMRDKFGLDFRIVDTEMLRQLRRERGIHINPWSHFPRLITSIDFLKRERPLRLMREALSADGREYPRPFDLLIVDEAHNVAPSGTGRYALDSQRTTAVRTLVPRFEHKLFLSATPHNGYQESFTALLEMLDNQRFARGVKPDEAQLGAVMVRRLKSELPKRWDGTDRFPRRVITPLQVSYSDKERHVHALLKRYSESRLTSGNGASENAAERVAAEFVLKLLKKRLFSSPAAFANTLERHIATITSGRRASIEDAQAAQSPSVLRRYLDQAEEDYADEEEYARATEDALQRSAARLRPLNAEQRALLDAMRDWGAQASRGVDSKAKELIEWLKRELMPGGVWSDQRVIIFTEYRDTQKWLYDLLANRNLTMGGRVMQLFGGMDSEEREAVKAAFQANPRDSNVRILLATDAASEGIDLQNYCSRLIHYEIPWNPNRMEQRNGRIDRHGQRASEVRVYHFVGAGYRDLSAAEEAFATPADSLEGDLEFLMRAARKVEQIREDLGTVGDVIARQVEEAMLGKRQRRLDTGAAESRAAPAKRLMRLNRDIKERIERLHEKLRESQRDLNITPEHIQTAVTIALEIAGQPPLRTVRVGQGAQAIAAWEVPPFKGSWAACVEGLAHPHTHLQRPIVFDADAAKDRDDVVLAHLNSRLVSMALRLLRAEIGASATSRKLKRVTARLARNEALSEPAVVVHARLLMLGGDGQRLHEEILTAGGALREGRFQRMNVGEVSRALAAALDDPASALVQGTLIEQAKQHAGPLEAALKARMSERAESLRGFLDQRAEAERKQISAVLNELMASIQAELNHPEIQQLELFTSEEREQLERNTGALERRLAEIPGELRRETEAISLRYANPQPRLFPVAVTYLIPERLGRG